LYQKVAVLNKKKHRKLRYQPQKQFEYTQNIQSCPLNGIEFFAASRDYPILFAKDKSGSYFPLAIMSLDEKGHRNLNTKGGWKADRYMPAFFRRYPFIISSKGEVCFDAKAPHFASKEKGELLFDEAGEYNAPLKNAINFLARFDKQNKKTQEYMQACVDAKLLKRFDINIRMLKNTQTKLSGLYMIDGAAFSKLSSEAVVEWHKKGWLSWTYAQMHSLGAIRHLLARQVAEEQ